jgi:4-alpha-glucanotransferase
MFWKYLRREPGESREVAPELMRLAWSSRAGLAIAPVQDLLDLGGSARMNIPGQSAGNWRWRLTEDMFAPAALDWLRDLTREAGRSPFDFVAVEPAALQEKEVTR